MRRGSRSLREVSRLLVGNLLQGRGLVCAQKVGKTMSQFATLPQARDCNVRRSSRSSMPVAALMSANDSVSSSLNSISTAVCSTARLQLTCVSLIGW